MGLVIDNPSSTDKLESFLNKPANKIETSKTLSYDHCVKADALRIRNYFLESIDEYLISLKYDDANIDAYKGMGLSYKQLGCIKSAIESFHSLRKLSPFDKKVYIELGNCYLEDGDYNQSIKYLQKAIKIDPKNIDAQFSLALIHELNNETEIALGIYNKIIEERPSFIGAYHNLGSLYLRLEMFSAAIHAFKKLIEINPEYSRGYLGLAVAFDKMHKINDSIRYYKKYLEVKPHSLNTDYVKERINALRSGRKHNESIHLNLIQC